MADRTGGSAEITESKDSATAEQGRNERHRLWLGVAVLIFLAGTVASLLAAHFTAKSSNDRSRHAFEASATQVTSTLQLAIQHEQDLVVNASSYIHSNPTVSNTTFLDWTSSVSILSRYPELVALGSVVLVPTPSRAASCLPHFALSRVVGPPGAAAPDLCASPAGPLLLAGRDSGVSAYFPYVNGSDALLGIETPIYTGNTIPTTVAGRRTDFMSWVGVAINPSIVLERSLQGHPGIAVTMTYHVQATKVAFSSGQIPRHPHSQAIDLGNGWTITTFGAVGDGAIDADAILLFAGGVVVSLLLGLFVLLLGTGRDRALRMVEERTRELRHQALHDGLTGLPNRALITDRIEQVLARDRRYGTVGSALYVDLDEFKNVNDTLGHEAGDRLLVAVAARLQTALRGADTIGRMGGDEFIVLIDEASLDVAPELVAERLLEVMRQPFELDGAPSPLIVTASIGIATGGRANAVELLRDADVALYQAKALGKNRYEFFHPELQSAVSHRIELEFDLRSALDGEQFRLVYQPIYNLEDLALVGVEALLRWDHPVRGLVQPDEFIPVLEQTGQIREVGRWVLLEACRQMAEWHARGDTLSMSVNVSGRQLDDDIIVEHIREALKFTGLAATSLIVEVTESALMRNTAVTARQLQAIKALGVRIAVDDFGTGYSSLAYLQQFHVDCLKIDRTFTNGVTESREAKALLGTLVQLGKDLGLKTLAEGVETSEQINHLRSQRVDEVQGFLLSRPLDPATLEARILAPARATAATR
jgi:diguanylate cyclase (GGDEF)-like protein